MDLIRIYFKQYNSALTLKLEDERIVGELAQSFISNTATNIVLGIKNTSLDKTIVYLLSDDPEQLLQLVNADSMALKLGMSSYKVNAGLTALAPVMSEIFKLKSNEIIAEAASLAWHDGDHIVSIAN